MDGVGAQMEECERDKMRVSVVESVDVMSVGV